MGQACARLLGLLGGQRAVSSTGSWFSTDATEMMVTKAASSSKSDKADDQSKSKLAVGQLVRVTADFKQGEHAFKKDEHGVAMGSVAGGNSVIIFDRMDRQVILECNLLYLEVLPTHSIPGLLTVYSISKEGCGAAVAPGDNVKTHAVGMVLASGKKFWKTMDDGIPFQYQAGVGEVITGWDKGCIGMRTGEERRLVIPGKEAYGADGFADWGIKPNATLVFTLECVSIGVGCVTSNPIATCRTSMGTFKAEIYLDRVPVTASNFIDLVQSGFYEGIHFHRVIAGLGNQFGCPFAKDIKKNSKIAGTGGPPDGSFKNVLTGDMETRQNGGNIKDEHTSKDSNVTGTLSMANSGVKDSGGSQFFINVVNNKQLDWFTPGSKHVVFGKVTEGLDVCQQINRVPTDEDELPLEPIKMTEITLENLKI